MAESKSESGTIESFLLKLKSSGEAAFEELSKQLMNNDLFMTSLKKSIEAKEHVDRRMSDTLDFVNLPSKNDFHKVLEELEAVRRRLAKQQRILAGLEQGIAEIKAMLTKPVVE